MVYTIEHIPEDLEYFFSRFQNDLSKPQFENLKAWTTGILSGLAEASKISGQYSSRHATSLTRFMGLSGWDHFRLNSQRIGWASNILQQKYIKYYPLIIDDTVNEKYGKLLAGVGKYWHNTKHRVVWGQQVLTSHLVLAGADIPLFVDLYRKKEDLDDAQEFQTKVEMAMGHIERFPKFEGRTGVVISDTWYATKKLMNKTLECEFEGIFALKNNRKVTYQGKQVRVAELAKQRSETDFKEKTVEGKIYRVWYCKVKLPGVKRKRVRLLISQKQLIDKTTEEIRWSDFKYLVVTDLNMRSWLILFLYRQRWKIETFYQFVKNGFDFAGVRLNSYESVIRYFLLLYFAYTYLELTRVECSWNYRISKSLYQAKEMIVEENLENLIDWIYNESQKGVNLKTIKLKLGFAEKNA